MTDWTWTPELAFAVAVTPALIAGAATWWHGYREGWRDATRKPVFLPVPEIGGDDE